MGLWIRPWKVAVTAVTCVLTYYMFLFPHILLSCATATLYGTGQRMSNGIDPT